MATSCGQDQFVLNPCKAQTILDILRQYLADDACVADIGCGLGATLSFLSAHSPYRLFGAEPNAAHYNQARCYCKDIPIVKAGAQALPFASRRFDAVIMECAFSLVRQPLAAARELYRILAYDGYLLIGDLYARSGISLPYGANATFGKIYAKEELKKLFTQSGLAFHSFADYTPDLRDMAAQMIMDGYGCSAFSPGLRGLFKESGVGYGLWVFEK